MFDEKFIDALADALAPRVAARMPKTGPGIVPRYLDLKQAAVYMSTTPHAVRRMLRDKHFPCRKIGSRTFIDQQDIDKAMAENLHYLN